MTLPADPYAVLGVSQTAPVTVITAAYRILSKEVHPDLAHGPADRKAREVRMRELNAARDLLRTPESRAAVDRRLAEEEQARIASIRRGAVEAELRRRSVGREPAGTWRPAGAWLHGRPAPSDVRGGGSGIPERGRWATAYVASLVGWFIVGCVRVVAALGVDGCVGVAMIATIVLAPAVIGFGAVETATLIAGISLVAIVSAIASFVISVGLDIRTATRLLRAR